MFGLTIKLIGAEKLIKSLTSKDTVGKPAEAGLKKLALQAKTKLIKATVADEGIARANIADAPIQYAPFRAIVTYSAGPGQRYIPFLEMGTSKMGARHMEGSTKVIGKGQGMFSYVKKWLAGKVTEAANHIAKDIEGKF